MGSRTSLPGRSEQKVRRPRRKPGSMRALEELGRVRLSPNFFFRDFLYSEIADFYGVPNIPDDPEAAIAVGRRLCEELLEPLQASFGRLAIRSGFRAAAVCAHGNGLGFGAGIHWNAGYHIWDLPDRKGRPGATACVAVPWFADRYARGADWPGGSTTTCPTRTCSSIPSWPPSTFSGARARRTGSRASSRPRATSPAPARPTGRATIPPGTRASRPSRRHRLSSGCHKPRSRTPGTAAATFCRRRAGPGSHRPRRCPWPGRSSSRSWPGRPRPGCPPSARSAPALR